MLSSIPSNFWLKHRFVSLILSKLSSFVQKTDVYLRCLNWTFASRSRINFSDFRVRSGHSEAKFRWNEHFWIELWNFYLHFSISRFSNTRNTSIFVHPSTSVNFPLAVTFWQICSVAVIDKIEVIILLCDRQLLIGKVSLKFPILVELNCINDARESAQEYNAR